MTGRTTPNWTPDEVDRLTTLIEQGISYTSIARRLGRSRTGVIIKAKRQHTRLLRVPGLYTCREVARLLGLSCSKKVARWIERGWLKAKNGGEPDRPLWRIAVVDLWDMLENPTTWMAWQVDRITDPDLRDWARELRQGQPQWMAIGDVARRFHVTSNTAKSWIAKGQIAGVRYGNWWIREDDLVGWVIPGDRDYHRRRAA